MVCFLREKKFDPYEDAYLRRRTNSYLLAINPGKRVVTPNSQGKLRKSKKKK
jgi:hypothetical protein